MDIKTTEIFFALLRSVVANKELCEDEKAAITDEAVSVILSVAEKHDILNIIAKALCNISVSADCKSALDRAIMKAVYRYRQLKYDYDKLCDALESAKIPFIPLKGSVIRKWYPEPWMRTSCDIDVLVHTEDIAVASRHLVSYLNYKEAERTSHDISFYSPQGTHIELHFDLVEEERANSANDELSSVWENASPRDTHSYLYEMNDEFFYFYHIAHMAKHFEVGGCGIRPLIDLWLLDSIAEGNTKKRNALLEKAELLRFADVVRKLSRVWLGGEAQDDITLKMQNYIIMGGVYGSIDNRVSIQQKRSGGKFKYVISRVFLPYSRLKRYYPVLEKHKWLTPVMQVRRWFRLLKPSAAKKAKDELELNNKLEASTADAMNVFLDQIGLK